MGIVIAILVLAILITVHEFGHFIAAKSVGIAVDEFSVGFGPKLFSVQKGETCYKICAIPLGGYCKMRGDDLGEGKEDPHAMYNRPAWARVITIIAGPFFNFLFAFLLLFILGLVGFSSTKISNQIQVVKEIPGVMTMPAYDAGLETGDKIVKIENENVYSFEDIAQVVAISIDKPLNFTIQKVNGNIENKQIIPVLSPALGIGSIGILPLYETLIGSILDESPAQKAGLEIGDKLLTINGQKITYFYELSDLVNENKFHTIHITGEKVDKTPFATDVYVDEIAGEGKIGIGPSTPLMYTQNIKAANLIDAFKMGFHQTKKILANIVGGLEAMVTGKVNFSKNVAGPIRIIQITGEVATQSPFSVLIQFVAMISLALGFFNILPLPALDGGQLVFNLAEMISGKKLNEKVIGVIDNIGMAFILILAVFVLMNDVTNIFKEKVGSKTMQIQNFNDLKAEKNIKNTHSDQQ